MVFKIVSVFRVNSYTKNNLNLVNFAIFILVLCHICFRTCYRIASAGLLLQEEPMVDSPSSAYNLKFVGTNSRQAPGSSHFASVADRMQAHAALNSTEQLCFPQNNGTTTVGSLVATTLKKCIAQIGLGHRHIHEQNEQNEIHIKCYSTV